MEDKQEALDVGDGGYGVGDGHVLIKPNLGYLLSDPVYHQ